MLPITMAEVREPPQFFDSARRPDPPDMRLVRAIRFLTEDEFPPFNFTGSGGALEGFNIDLARALCTELAVPCTIQARRWDGIEAALTANAGDAIIAGLSPLPARREAFLFSEAYLRLPARFVVKSGSELRDTSQATLKGRRIGVVAGSAHEAYLMRFFPDATPIAFPTPDAARMALIDDKLEAVFGDGFALAFWLNGESSKDCCRFLGGPFLESRYMGEGFAIAVRSSDIALKRALDLGLFRLQERGVFADIFRRWFPIDPFSP